MNAPRVLPDASVSLALLCRVQECLCVIPVAHVVETMRPLPIVPVAGTPPFVLGMAVIRGEPVPVVDAARLLAGAETRPARFVTVRAGDRRIALAVEGVLGVRAIRADSMRRLPPLLENPGSNVISEMGTLDAELLLVLRSARLVPDDAWRSILGGEVSQ